MSIQDIAEAFTTHFYTALAAQNYDGLAALYVSLYINFIIF
jgi:hypothetical protein